MANLEHVEIVKQGVEVWNKWREKHREIVPDLAHAHLIGAALVGANLIGAVLRGTILRDADLISASLNSANLKGADLSNARLSGAALRDANLIGATLRDANLKDANLRDAILYGADFAGADLSSTDFIGANLKGADLKGADLSGAVLREANLSHSIVDGAYFTNSTIGDTTLASIDLSEAIGLETVEHWFPSTIGIDTLYKSAGKIPEVFLRGCGVPESFIVQMHALVTSTEPIQFYSCFISYSSKDHPFALRLYADLQNRGVRCWFAPEDLKIGDRFRSRIDESIRVYDKLLLVLSENSVASSWVEKEVETAMERETEDEKHRTILFPVRLDDAVMNIKTGWPADVRRTRHIGDFTNWKDHDSYSKAFERLLRDLKA